ncbi:biliverdin-producing heme oxygenase [Novosphingobium aquimarinum]|uniref:biliverdin-producing heme oxygenase n=1 Tax=Novosphingobium aquimarinum TaxID=2682494 RepID=UPI0012EC3CDD|nr:biliverdin-producing heme oxygenase [Novosphingobium aquimarinum]
MLPALRIATGPAHSALDKSFGSLDLDDRGDYARFLLAHAIGLMPLFSTYREFVTQELRMPTPDFTGMLAADLGDLGLETPSIPEVSLDDDLSAPGIAYVVSGSRLGLTMIRRNGYWGRAHGQPSRYMEDDSGLEVWKSLVGWMKQKAASEQDEERASRAALTAFDVFGCAFEASAPACVQ